MCEIYLNILIILKWWSNLQYVWGETCAIGCAAVYCSGIKNGKGVNEGHIIICNYGERYILSNCLFCFA